MINLDEAIRAYFDLRMGGLATSTVKAHRNQIRRMHQWLIGDFGVVDIPIADIDADVLIRYLETIAPPRLSASSYNNYRQYVTLFFDFCRAEGWIVANPARYSRAARGRKRAKLWLAPDQVRAMMNGVEPRDRFAIALGFATSLRATDVASLTVGAIDRKHGWIDVTIQKTQTRQRFPLTRDLDDELTRWLKVYLDTTGGDGNGKVPKHWLLVPALHHYAINVHDPQRGVVKPQPDVRLGHPERIVHRGLETLRLPTFGEGFHTIRRSSARHLYNVASAAGSRSAIRIVQAHLGHRSQATTEAYLGLKPDQVERDELLRFRRFLP